MLSFMKDQQEGNQAQAQAQTQPSDQTGPQEYLTVAGKTQRTRQSTLVVIVMFVIGLVVLGVMVKKCQPKAAAAAPAKDEESQIETAIGRLTGVSAEMTSRMDQIMQKFHDFSAVVQVAVDELAKNPFELQAEAQKQEDPGTLSPVESTPTVPATQVEVQVQNPSTPTPVAAPVPAATPEEAATRLTAAEAKQREAEEAKIREEAKRRQAEETKRLAAEEAKRRDAEQALQQYQQKVKSKATELKLQSILQSSAGTRCMIDDTLVRVGDQVKGFQVIQIGDNCVHLLWSEPPMPDIKIILKITE